MSWLLIFWSWFLLLLPPLKGLMYRGSFFLDFTV